MSTAHDDHTYSEVVELLSHGLSDYEVSRRTGVCRGSVRNWRIRDTAPAAVVRERLGRDWAVTAGSTYSYLLGVYLGDGTVCFRPPHTPWLQVVNDRRYPGISDEITRAMELVFPGATARRHASFVGKSDVLHIRHPAVLRAFPQHGPGRKHLRPIALADWQRELTHAHPESLIRGLIHSDGCRAENRFRTQLPSGRVATYAYVRYFFTNHSADIRGIFIEHCELLGIRVTHSNHRNLSISHRTSIAIIEEAVGPKR